MSEQEMIESYIYEVTRRVPQETREEIRMELGGLIEDMGSKEGISAEEVLEKLGDPAVFARRYREDNNYLIGPEYYDDYVWVLKIALIGIGISAVVSAVVNGIMGAGNLEIAGLVNLFIIFFEELLVNAISGALGAVGVITAVFAFLEWQKVRVKVKPEKAWSPFSLSAVPDNRAVIKRGDSVFSIVFASVFAAFLLFAPEVFGAFRYEDGRFESIASVFNMEKWGNILPVFLLCLAVGLVDEIIRLVTGCYCKVVMYSTIACNILQVAGAVLLFYVLPLWNPDFSEQIRVMAGVGRFSEGDILSFWNTGRFNALLFLIILCCCLLEVGITIYKTLKYGKRESDFS